MKCGQQDVKNIRSGCDSCSGCRHLSRTQTAIRNGGHRLHTYYVTKVLRFRFDWHAAQESFPFVPRPPSLRTFGSEVRDHAANDQKCSDLGWACVPLAVEESYGAWANNQEFLPNVNSLIFLKSCEFHYATATIIVLIATLGFFVL